MACRYAGVARREVKDGSNRDSKVELEVNDASKTDSKLELKGEVQMKATYTVEAMMATYRARVHDAYLLCTFVLILLLNIESVQKTTGLAGASFSDTAEIL